MNKYKFIGLKEQAIYGIKNPQLSVVGTMRTEDYKFEVTVDSKEIEFEYIGLDGDDFVLRADLPKSAKEVKVYVITKEDKYCVVSIKNNWAGRIYRKIIKTIRKILIKIKVLFLILYRGMKFLWREHHFLVPPSMWKKYLKAFVQRFLADGYEMFYHPFRQSEYLKWIEESEVIEPYEKQKYEPLISILIPVYNIEEEYLSACIESILSQSYQNFEICLVDDHSTLGETKETLEKYAKKDTRIKVKYREENGHISKTTNDALQMATGEFVALIDNDDIITENALGEVVKVLNKDTSLDFIYSDEDKLDVKGRRCDPHFKPDFSPDTLLSLNYICHFSVLRKSIVEEVGGFTVGLEGAQDHDLFLKVSEKTNKIHHIAKILYHWRMVEGSTSMTISNKSYATDKGKIAIENALQRRNIKGHVEKDVLSTYYRVVYEYEKEPSVSIIIPTRDYADILDKCLLSLYEKTNYKNYEVIVVNNNSEKKETFALFEKYKKQYQNFKVLDANIEFNYSRINNLAVKKSKAECIVLLNNDTEIISEDWLQVMVGYAMQPHIGTVGPKLLYPDTTVQHAGVLLGLGGVASHAYIGSARKELGMFGKLRVPYDYSAVTAACLAITRKKYEEVGGLEEELMVAYNDIDFNIKLLKKGYYNVCVPQVELFHYESKSRGLDTTSEKYKRFLKESNYMFEKWGEEIMNDRFYNPNFTKKAWFLLDKKKENKNDKGKK
ncbi:MAG: glycosyltransferase [Bacilli bacterium]|nr:glycosyltransferase [Bacilli bacterium]